jgi:Bacterial Ig domain
MNFRLNSALSCIFVALTACELSAAAGTLTGSFSSLTTNVDLTSAGKSDWVHWGLYTDTSVDRKWGVPAQIGDLGTISSFGQYTYVYQYSDNYNGYAWYDGWPDVSVTNTTTGVWAYQAFPLNSTNWGFKFSVPADTTNRTLLVYVGAFAARGQLTATLSDGGAPYVDSSLYNTSNGPGGVYTLSFQAASAGQTLTVKWLLYSRAPGPNTANANVTIQAAALTLANAHNPPMATLTSPAAQSAFPAPASIGLSADAAALDGTITNVVFFAGTNRLGASSTAPYSVTWNNAQTGHYYLTAEAFDSQGSSRPSLPVEVFVYGTGGSLSGTLASPPIAVDLTLEGTNDWMHWGLVTNTSVDRKSGVTPQLGFELLGSSPPQQYGDNYTGFSWEDGVPTPTATNSTTGIFVTGLTNGFYLTAPADTASRRLRVYVGGYGSQGSFEAFLGDFSGAPYIDDSTGDPYNNVYSVYELSYAAASPGQQLVVLYQAQNLYDFVYGNVTLQAASLAGGPLAPQPVLITNPRLNGTDFLLSFQTQTGYNYTIQYAPTLPPPSWTDLTTVPGTGGLVTVTNLTAGPLQGYYRVRAD